MSDIHLVSPAEAHYTVYKLTDPVGKVYIGYTGTSLKKRWQSGGGYWRNRPFREAITFYGWENFKKEVLCEKLTKEGAEKLEKWFIEYYDSINPEKGYNCYTGGSRAGSKANIQTREGLRRTKLALVAEDPEYCQKHKDVVLAYYRDHPEVKKRISFRVSAYLKTPAGERFIHSNKHPKPVRCVETGEVFRSQRAAEKITGFQGIHKTCSGLQSMSGGYHWEYV